MRNAPLASKLGITDAFSGLLDSPATLCAYMRVLYMPRQLPSPSVLDDLCPHCPLPVPMHGHDHSRPLTPTTSIRGHARTDTHPYDVHTITVVHADIYATYPFVNLA